MNCRSIFILLAILTCQQLFGQDVNKITGPLGVYHIGRGYSYSNISGTDSLTLEDEFKFGELCILNQDSDAGFNFQAQIDSCNLWKPNKIFGIIQPLTEGGVNNQLTDTALFAPTSPPGIIQGAQRFSRLSQLYSGFCGVILDDWNGDTTVTRQVRDALQGKYIDSSGNVCDGCVATTPNNKLYAVIYNNSNPPTAAQLPLIDGVSWWNNGEQNCCYTSLDDNITQLLSWYPHKEILIGIYLRNSALGWTNPAGVQYMLSHAIDRYDDGDINGIIIFAGYDLTTNSIPLGIYDSFALPYWLDSLYYPFLGAGQGKIYDCQTGNGLAGASIRVFCRSSVPGDSLLRSSQLTDTSGQYGFGLWAGNRNTDSTYYWLIAEKTGYVTDTAGFWIKRGDTASIPNLSLCPAPNATTNTMENILLFPNPTSGKFTVQVDTSQTMGGVLEVYNLLGKRIYSATQTGNYSSVDLSYLPDGFYLVFLQTNNVDIDQRGLLLIEH